MNFHKNERIEKGLSLIESAMVLALAAIVVAAVLFYYNNAKEKSLLSEGVKAVQSVAAAMNKLYAGAPSVSTNGSVVNGISALTGLPLKMVGNVEVLTTPTGGHIDIWSVDSMPRAYNLEIYTYDISSCMAYSTLNFGTIMRARTEIRTNSASSGGEGNSDNIVTSGNGFALTPSEAAKVCEKAFGQAGGTSATIKIRYTLGV